MLLLQAWPFLVRLSKEIKRCIIDASIFDMYVCVISIDIELVDIWFYVTVPAVSRHFPGPLPLGEGKIERAGGWSLEGFALSS